MPPMDIRDVGFIGNVANWAAPRNPNVTVNDGSTDGTKTTVDGKDYYRFTSSGDFVVSSVGGDDPVVKVMLLAGGGSTVLKYYAGGSGAGGMFFNDVVVSAQTYAIVVGGGRSDTTGFGKTAIKGANAAPSSSYGSPADGGCGAGNRYYDTVAGTECFGLQPNSASGGIGYDGGNSTTPVASRVNSGGGGGCGAVGTDGFAGTGGVGNGGAGASDSFLENILTNASCGTGGYIGGGGGAAANYWAAASTGGLGGAGGGGNSGALYNGSGGGSGPLGGCPAQPLAANCGGGGGASGYCSTQYSGGSGICVVVVG